MEIVAKTLEGFEKFLAQELIELGADNIQILHRAVSFEGDKALMYKANYCLRTAIRVLKPILKFSINNQEDLYDKLIDFEWQKYLDNNMTFAVNATASSDIFSHTQFLALKTKDAIVDHLRNKTGSRPSIDLRTPDIRFDIMVRKQDVTLSLDSSDLSLHKRNYKKNIGIAPLSEVLAAGLIYATEWDMKTTFVDPMCGSGTLAMEACLMASKIPPQIKRSQFGFKNWKDFNSILWEEVKSKAKDMIEDAEVEIHASDKSSDAVFALKQNIKTSPLFADIIVQKEDFFFKEGVHNSLLVFNPPYDVRIKTEELEKFYKRIGDTLKKGWNGAEAWIFSGNLQAIKSIGLRTSRRLSFKNGPIQCKFHKFELYAGSKKHK